MSLEEALEIFGLNSNFTEDELRIAYRVKVKQNHPDQYDEDSKEEKEANEKLKKITVAYDFLARMYGFGKYNNGDNRTNSSAHDSLELYRREVLKKMNYYAQYDKDSYVYPDIFGVIVFRLNNWISNNYYNIIQSEKEKIDKIFGDFKNIVYNNFQVLAEKIYEYNNIPSSYGTNLNYDCSIGEFYNQLLDVIKKYRDEQINRIFEETEKYEGYAGYKELKNGIDALIIEAIEKSKRSDIDEVMQQLHRDIEEEFKNYFEINEKINAIRMLWLVYHPSLSSNDSDRILANLNSLDEEYHEAKDSSIKNKLIALEQELNQLINKTRIASNVELNQYYRMIVELYSKKLLELNAVSNQKEIQQLTEHFSLIMAYFNKISDGIVPVNEAITVLSRITLGDYETERELLTGVAAFKNKSGVYIKIKNQSIMFDKSTFFLLDEIDGQKMMFKTNPIVGGTTNGISDTEVEHDYISLEDFLAISTYVGKEARNSYDTYLFILYQNKYGVIYLSERGTINVNVSPHTNFILKSNDKSPTGESYKDKQKLMDDIKSSIETQYNRYKQAQEVKSGISGPAKRTKIRPF